MNYKQKNRAAALPEETVVKSMKAYIIKYRKPITITLGITVLNLFFGFDARFTIINLLWLLV